MRALSRWHPPTLPSRRTAALTLILLSVACAREPESDPLQPPPARLPAFERVMVPGLDTLPTSGSPAPLAVSRNGHVATTYRSAPAAHGIWIVDTLGKVSRADVRGAELTSSVVFLSFPSPERELVVFDAGNRRFVTFNVNGRHIHSTASFDAGMPIGTTGDSTDMLMFSDEAQPMAVARFSGKTLGHRLVIDGATSVTAGFRAFTPVVSNRGEIIIAHPVEYRFHSYDGDGRPVAQWGRDLPPRYYTGSEVDSIHGKRGAEGQLLPFAPGIREKHMETRERQFHNIVVDGLNRMWAAGVDTSGTEFADIFADTTYVGRINFPCKPASYQPAFNGEWMAIQCAAPQNAQGTEVRLYRVVR